VSYEFSVAINGSQINHLSYFLNPELGKPTCRCLACHVTCVYGVDMDETIATDQRHAIAALLDWYGESGVDMAVDESPHDRFAESAAKIQTIEQPALPARTALASYQPTVLEYKAAILAPEEAVIDAQSRAARATTLEELRELLATFEGCGLRTTANRLVFSGGTAGSRIMLVGEAPGAEEDKEGMPFVGRSGKLLDLMLAGIGLDRSKVYIANIVPWRPPGNRTPTPQESAVCLPFIRRQIELCAPDILLCLGGPSAQTLLQQRDGILKLRGNWFDFQCGDQTIKALPTLHPAYLLRQPLQKRLAWRDMLILKAALN
jgi:uracil-DNA glycosylase